MTTETLADQMSGAALAGSESDRRRAMPTLASTGYELNRDGDALGWFTDSSPLLGDREALHARMQRDGYLFLPGLLDREKVLTVRSDVLERMAAAGHLAPGTDPADAIPARTYDKKFQPDLARDNEILQNVLYAGTMMAFFRMFFGEEVRHFDYTWFRAVPPGAGTASHCDVVYMGRGTSRLYTAWTPMGDIPLETGGLMILEGSNNNARLRNTYCKTDVDTYCSNRNETPSTQHTGVLSTNPVQLQKTLGGRWLITDYRAGDVLIFTTYTVHASLDNGSHCMRLSSDSRYQPAADIADERWIGEKPIGHSQAGKRGRIC